MRTPATMDSIKKKMRSLAQATEEASSVANKFDTETKATIEIAEKYEEQVGGRVPIQSN